MHIWTHTLTHLLLITLILLSGCDGENTMKQSEPSITCGVGSAIQKGHLTDIQTGQSLTQVEVSIDGCSTKTDTNGFYILNNVSKNSGSLVTFKKEGYILGSTKIEIKESKNTDTKISNFLEYALYPYENQYAYASSKKILNSHLNIDTAMSFRDKKNNPYDGEVSIQSTMLDTKNKTLLNIFPGTFSGINIDGKPVIFSTYGLISISINDKHGNALELEDGELLTLTFNGRSSEKSPLELLPLWYYNTKKGIWIEEGYAQLQDNGTYKGQISHIGIWSLNKIENEAGIYRGRLHYPDGTAVQNARVTAVGGNWKKMDLSTDNNGLFEVKVIPNSSFKLSAYNYKFQYNAEYNAIIPAILENEIIQN